MPLTKIQTEILRLLAAHRNPESYVAGSTPLNRDASRYSGDIDFFHDREELVARVAAEDASILAANGYALEWKRREPAIFSVVARRSDESTKLEWVADGDYRFSPTLPDEVFGYILHPSDLAMNKVMAAVGRRAVRDVVDLVTIHETILPLGAVIWAAVEKAPGFSPESIIAEIRRNSRYPAADWRAIMSADPLDPCEIVAKLRIALDEADNFVSRMPSEKSGLLFLKNDRVVEPDPARLGGL